MSATTWRAQSRRIAGLRRESSMAERGAPGDGFERPGNGGLTDWPGIEVSPDILSGDDGEVVFVRRDVADTIVGIKTYALEQGHNLYDLEVDEVEMLPVPEYFTEIDYDWAVVKPGTPGAIAFWRFRV